MAFGNVRYLQKFVEEECEPVRQHFLSDRLCPANPHRKHIMNMWSPNINFEKVIKDSAKHKVWRKRRGFRSTNTATKTIERERLCSCYMKAIQMAFLLRHAKGSSSTVAGSLIWSKAIKSLYLIPVDWCRSGLERRSNNTGLIIKRSLAYSVD